MSIRSKNELVSELAFTQAKLDIAIREFNKMVERKNLEIAQAHAAGRTAGLQEAKERLITMANAYSLAGYLKKSGSEKLPDEYNQANALREGASAVEVLKEK
jgi:hypothetical protein